MGESGYDFTKIERLKRLREAEENRDISYKEIADAVGVSDGTLWSLAAGRHTNPSSETLRKIAVYFGVTPDYFLRDYEEPEGNEEGLTLGRVRPIVPAAL